MAPMASSAASMSVAPEAAVLERPTSGRAGDGHDLEVGLDLDHLRRAREVAQERLRHEAGLEVPNQGRQLERGHDRPVVGTFGWKRTAEELPPDAASLHGRQHEELGQLADIVTQDRSGVADHVLVVIDGNPARGRPWP